MGRAKFWVVFIVLLFGLGRAGNSQNFISKNITTNDGLPSSECYDVTQDDDGYIWIASDKGIIKYHNQGLKVFDESNGLKSSTVFRLIPKGSKVWFFTFNKFLQYIENDVVYTPLFSAPLKELLDSIGAGPNELSINDKEEVLVSLYHSSKNHGYIKIDEHGSIKLHGLENSFAKQSSIISAVGFLPIQGVNRSYTDNKGLVKLVHINNSRVVDSFLVMTAPSRSLFSGHSFLLEEGDLKLFSLQNFIWNIHQHKKTDSIKIPFTISGSLFQLDSNHFAIGRSGRSLVTIKTSQNKFVECDSSDNELVNISGGFIDREGSLWLTSLQKGVFYINNPNILKPKGPISQNSISNLFVHKGLVWALSTYGQLSIFNPRTKKAQHEFISLDGNHKSQFEPISEGTKEFKSFLKSEGFTIDDLGRKSIRKGDSLWMSYTIGFGLRVNNENRFNSFRELNISERFNTLHQNGNILYLGGLNGLSKFYIHERKYLSAKEVNPEINFRINDIAELGDNHTLLASNGKGLCIVDSNEKIVQFISIEQGLSSKFCNSIFKRGNNEFWVSTNKGVSRVILRKNDSLFEPQIRVYNRSHGIISNEVAHCVVENEMVYVGTKEGLCYFEIQDISPNLVPPNIFIEDISVNGIKLPKKEHLVLQNGQNNIQIIFNSLTFKTLEDPMFYYYFSEEAQKGKWKSIDQDRIQFSDLTPGNYSFEVKAINNDGVQSTESAAITFSIAQVWWRTWSFLLFLCGCLIMVVFGFLKFRIARIQRQNELELRTKELKQMALTAQLNPHFIFNAMGSIQSLILQKKLTDAEDYLTGLARLMRSILNRANEPFSTIESEIQLVRQYVKLENLRFSDKIGLSLELDHSISIQKIKIPAMLLQTLVENAILHGLLPAAKKGHIVIRISLDSKNEDSILVEIEDDGVGLPSHGELTKENILKHKPMGMTIVKERLSTYSEIYKNKFFVEIVDIKTIDPSRTGSIVKMKLPYSYE